MPSFAKTYKFLEKIKFYKMHIFKYSPRKGTRAEQMPQQIEPQLKEERSKKLIELSDKNEKEYNSKYVGKRVEVLWEEQKNEIYKGHTKNYVLVEMEAKPSENKENVIESVQISQAYEHYVKV